MTASVAVSKSPSSTAPADLDTVEITKETDRKVDFANYRPTPQQSVAIELEYATKAFPLGGDEKLHASAPLRFAYVDDAGTVEIVGWNLRVNLDEAKDLPRQIARRFLELFSKAGEGRLDEQEEASFDRVCEQIDYRRFCAGRALPHYREAMVVRKSPALIRYLGGANIRLEPGVASRLELVGEGEYFGGYFSLDREGRILDIRNIVLVPSPAEILADDNPDAYRLPLEERPDAGGEGKQGMM